MKSKLIAVTAFLLLTALYASSQTPQKPFDTMKSLAGTWVGKDPMGSPMQVSYRATSGGSALEIDPPRLLVYTWFASWHPDPSVETIVRYQFTPVAGGTQLKVTHSGLAQLPNAHKSYGQGWTGLLDAIKKFVEAQS